MRTTENRMFSVKPGTFKILRKASQLAGVSMSQYMEQAVLNQVSLDDRLPRSYMKLVRKEVGV